jgi:hypothetical protein
MSMRAQPATAMLLATSVLACGCSGRKAGDPFSYTKVAGKVCYEDGSLIPVRALVLTFIPLETVAIDKKFARPGRAVVDGASGAFESATTFSPHDGIVTGRHRVVLGGVDNVRLPESLVPARYKDQMQSPIEIDTRKQPLEIRVARPK